MNIRESIIEDRSNDNIWRIARYIVENPKELESLWVLITDLEDANLRMRAAWALGKVVESKPKLLNSLYSRSIDLLKGDIDHGVRRSLLRSIQCTVIPEEYYIVLFDMCSLYIANPKEPVAIRMFSMKINKQIVKAIPDLAPEYLALMESIEESVTTTGLRNIYGKVLRWLKSQS